MMTTVNNVMTADIKYWHFVHFFMHRNAKW